MNEENYYTIDEKYIFEQSTSLIYLKYDRSQNVELSKPAARLLNEIILINLKKGIATRDELLTNVWEEHGLVGSNNNLNTYISEIRKKLEQIGIDPKSIVTVPKKGFRLDSHISIHENIASEEESENGNVTYFNDTNDHIETSVLPQPPVNNDVDIHSSFTPATDDFSNLIEKTEDADLLKNKNDIHAISPANKNEVVAPQKSTARKIFNMFFLLFLIILTSYVTYFFMQNSRDKPTPTNSYLTVSSHQNCIIQIPTYMVGKISNDNIRLVNSKLKKYNIPCDTPKKIILLSDFDKSFSIDHNISICICEEINKKYDCISINDQRI